MCCLIELKLQHAICYCIVHMFVLSTCTSTLTSSAPSALEPNAQKPTYTHTHTQTHICSCHLPSPLTCRKMAESFWYSFTSCRLAMVSITPMALPAIAMAIDSSTTWRHSGMMANTSEMMRVQEKRADREDRSLGKTSNTLCSVFWLYYWSISNET